MFRTTLSRTRRPFASALCLSLALLVASATPAAACSWDYLIWMPREKDADALYRFIRDGRAGFIDRSGKVVIEPQFRPGGNYDDVFREGVLEIEFGSGRFVDKEGKEVEPAPYRGEDFSEGLAAVRDEETGQWGYVNREGKYVISPRFCSDCYVSRFSGGRAWIRTSYKYGLIDRSGEFVVPPTFLLADNFSDGMARVVVNGGPCVYHGDGPCPGTDILGFSVRDAADVPPCRFTFVDRRGNVLDERFDNARDFSEGLAPVLKNGKWGYIDKSGRLVIEPRFDNAQPFSEGRGLVKEGDLYGFIDERGELVIPAKFKDAFGFSDGLAAVGSLNWEGAGGLYYIDRQGRTVIPGPFRIASHFFKGLAHVEYDRTQTKGKPNWLTHRFAYIDTKGKTVFAYEFDVEH
jgi:hypothetical protein